MSASAPAADLAGSRQLVEELIGRPLRLAEQVIDVLKLDRALNAAKDEIERAIALEQKRLVNRMLGGAGGRLEMKTTRAMLAPLEQLYRLGVDEARAELERAGYDVTARALASPAYEPLRPHAEKLDRGLHGLALRIVGKGTGIDLADLARAEIARELYRVAGARGIASGLVSSALIAGLGATFEQHSDLVTCWEYTSVLDGGTCEICEPLDGTEYHSLDELFDVLPDFGPNPDCLGGDRCRCRAVPCSGAD